jgi:hypothetical protein
LGLLEARETLSPEAQSCLDTTFVQSTTAILQAAQRNDALVQFPIGIPDAIPMILRPHVCYRRTELLDFTLHTLYTRSLSIPLTRDLPFHISYPFRQAKTTLSVNYAVVFRAQDHCTGVYFFDSSCRFWSGEWNQHYMARYRARTIRTFLYTYTLNVSP